MNRERHRIKMTIAYVTNSNERHSSNDDKSSKGLNCTRSISRGTIKDTKSVQGEPYMNRGRGIIEINQVVKHFFKRPRAWTVLNKNT